MAEVLEDLLDRDPEAAAEFVVRHPDGGQIRWQLIERILQKRPAAELEKNLDSNVSARLVEYKDTGSVAFAVDRGRVKSFNLTGISKVEVSDGGYVYTSQMNQEFLIQETKM